MLVSCDCRMVSPSHRSESLLRYVPDNGYYLPIRTTTILKKKNTRDALREERFFHDTSLYILNRYFRVKFN